MASRCPPIWAAGHIFADCGQIRLGSLAWTGCTLATLALRDLPADLSHSRLGQGPKPWTLELEHRWQLAGAPEQGAGCPRSHVCRLWADLAGQSGLGQAAPWQHLPKLPACCSEQQPPSVQRSRAQQVLRLAGAPEQGAGCPNSHVCRLWAVWLRQVATWQYLF